MSGVFSKPKATPQIVEEPTPEVIDTSDKTQAEEQARKKRRGVASQIFAGSGLSDIRTGKTSLGA